MAYWLGLTGTPGGPRRFLRVAFGFRLLLVAITPLFFFLPDRQYGEPSTRWPAFALLLVWTGLIGVVAWKRTQLMREVWWISALDVAVGFGVFVVTTRWSHGTAISYGSVVVVGSFQLQTYGPMISIGALSGAWAGLMAGISGALIYPIALAASGRSLDGLFGPSQIASTLGRSALYLIFGLVLGVFRDLATQGDEARELQQEAETRQREAEASEHEREQELKILHRFHVRGLGTFGVVLQNLRDMGGQLPGEAGEDLLGLARGFETVLDRLRNLTSPSPGAKTIGQVLREVEGNHQIYPLLNKERPVSLEIRDRDAGAQTLLSPIEADHLVAIISEAVGNAKKHARKGSITIDGVTRGARDFMILVRDPGPEEQPGTGFNMGHDTINEYTLKHGWWWNFEPAKNGRGSGVARFIIPLPAIPDNDGDGAIRPSDTVEIDLPS